MSRGRTEASANNPTPINHTAAGSGTPEAGAVCEIVENGSK